MNGEGLAARLAGNPFFVLAVPTSATQREIEREGDKLLAMLALGLAEVNHYLSPLGPQARTQEAVREAMAELRDPQKRLLHEWLAALLPVRSDAPPVASAPTLDVSVFAVDPLRRRP